MPKINSTDAAAINTSEHPCESVPLEPMPSEPGPKTMGSFSPRHDWFWSWRKRAWVQAVESDAARVARLRAALHAAEAEVERLKQELRDAGDVRRYDPEDTKPRGYVPCLEMVEREDGDWVRYDDLFPAPPKEADDA